MSSEREQRVAEIADRLAHLDQEKQDLLRELKSLQSPEHNEFIISTSPEARIALFTRLFCCRTDVFPKLWENRCKGIKGYSPACANEWRKDLCAKSMGKFSDSKIRCSECSNRDFILLNEAIVRDHLEGKITVGTYAIRTDDTCIFIAADFDKETWKTDIAAYRDAGREMGVEIAVERSRSGNGGHAWIFFCDPIPARIARVLGTKILTQAISLRHTISLRSYDRFFPCQDSIPAKGFGNLIALPLQREPRRKGNSVFVDDDFVPYPDQWDFIGRLRLFSLEEVRKITGDISKTQNTDSASGPAIEINAAADFFG
jgi:hypothetical protein